MKQTILILAFVLTMTSCTQPQKIGFVNNSELINEYQGKKDVEAKFKTIEETSKKKTDSLNQAYQLEAISLQSKLKGLSSERLQANSDYQSFQQKWQLINQQVQAEQQNNQEMFKNEIDSSIVEVVDFVKGYAKTNGYAYILGTSDVSRSVMYGEDAGDLTDKVIEAINKEYTPKK